MSEHQGSTEASTADYVQRAFNEMREGFALHRIIVDDTGTPIDYEFIVVNPAFERLTGLDADRMVGKTVREVLPDVEDDWILRYGEVALTGRPITFELHSAPLNRTYEVRAYSPEYGLFAAIFSDVSERVSIEGDMARSARALETLSAVSRLIDRAGEEVEFLTEACNAAVRISRYQTVVIGYLVDDGSRSIQPIAWSGLAPDLVPFATSWGDGASGQGVAGRAVRERRSIVIRSAWDDPSYSPWHAVARDQGYRSAAALPIFDSDGGVRAVLGVTSGEADAFDEQEMSLLQEIALEVSRGIGHLRSEADRRTAERALAESYSNLSKAFRDLTKAMGRAVEKRDAYTSGHQRRVAELSLLLAARVQLPREDCEGLEVAALLHDVGKLGIPIEILAKPGALGLLEFGLIKTHSSLGFEILKDIAFPWPVAPAVLQHHERLDGSGYPAGLKSDEIGQYARIIAVADVVEAMVSDRPYRPALTWDDVAVEFRDHGSKYDTDVVRALRTLESEGALEEWIGPR